MRTIQLTCDGCLTDFTEANIIEKQEFLHWETVGGYGAPFGDMNHVTLDLCPDCQKGILGKHVRVDGEQLREDEL